MTLFLNQARSCFLAKALTSVGASRVSIGPPISVMDRGVGALASAFIRAVLARTGTAGWQTARMWVWAPRCSTKVRT